MSYTYLQEQGEEFSAESYWDIPVSVRLRLSDTGDGQEDIGRKRDENPKFGHV